MIKTDWNMITLIENTFANNFKFHLNLDFDDLS